MTWPPPVPPPARRARRGRAAPRSAPVARLATSAWLRRLGVCVGAVLVLAVMTGPAGSNAAPTSGFTTSLAFPRLFWFIGFAAVLFTVISIWRSFGLVMSARAGRARSRVRQVTAPRRVRLGLDVAVVAFGLIWVSFISPHDTWKGGVCIQIGCGFAAMELLVYLFERRSLRLARLAGYAVLALYGALAWMVNTVSKYLNSIGAVPHDRSLGRLFLWFALGLAVLEAVLAGLVEVRRLVAAQRRRRLGTALGVVLFGYGWLTWTTWSLWREPTPHSVAHWLASVHLMTHNRPAGLVLMVVGGVVLAGALLWVGADLVRAIGGTVPSAAALSSPGSRRRPSSPTGRRR